MRSRPWIWILLCLLLAAGVWFLRPQSHHLSSNPQAAPSAPPTAAASKASPLTILATNNVQAAAAARAKANEFRYRLSNTTRTLGELTGDPHAILLANAFIDTRASLNLSIPKALQAPADPGAYIVQANGRIDNAFRARLTALGARIVSYIPNNAYLVTLAASGAEELAADGFAVIPYEPYYKVSAPLLPFVGESLPADATLTVELFPGQEQTGIQEIEAAGGKVLSQEASPNGLVLNVQPPADWTAVPALPGVHIVEPAYRRVAANDLSRAMVGVAADTQTQSNYLSLTGSNVLVEVNDSGIDMTHPDLLNRVFGDVPISVTDTNGHGTHVAGIIAGDGFKSLTVTNAQDSIMPATTNQFRGMAPAATLFSVGSLGSDADATSDRYLQETPARTNALISNNSWNYDGDAAYDLAAASYDAAVRDALPQVTGSQPVLFVFSAGNDGNGDDTTDPGNGTADSIASPATAKNVITVGAIQEFRNITNEVTNADLTIGYPWQPETSTSYRIAGFSSRGNVGINTEGTYGRFKPDVVAPGTFIISTRSSQWDINTYFYQSPTNFDIQEFSVVVQADSLGANEFPLVPTNAVQATIQLVPNPDSPVPFPFLPIYFGLLSSSAYDFVTTNNQVSIPPDGGLTIPDILSSEAFYGFNYAISNITSEPINLDIIQDTITTNNPGNYFLVYSNLDNSLDGNVPPHYYRYETGTSMAAADASGVLALIQDYFTNTLQTIPSPALLKALLINGARPTGQYDLQVANDRNYEGWGLINLPNSLPLGFTNLFGPGVSCSSFFVDQSTTNALATGDSHTYLINISTNAQQAALPLRITLAWTDPPGDPAAAIKLVNNLDLVVTNLDDPANPVIFYGNDIGPGSLYNTPESTNTPPNLDVVNNVENVFISPPLGTSYSITVIGREVNVNAVTAHTNNVVQDYALVIACGEGEVSNSISGATDNGIVSNPTGDQQISFLGGTNVDAALLNQFVGASTPLLGTNTVLLGTVSVLDTNGVPVAAGPAYASNAIVTLGMTNQWHFYVITNPVSGASDVTNAGFITFLPDTLSVPRMGVFADSTADATTPEADIDLYVTTDPTLTNLNPVAIANCVNGTQVGMSAAGVFNGASLSRGGTEFVVDINSKPGQIYYVGVYSERQVASEYDFLSIFTSTPFSQMQNGNQIVNGQLVPAAVPDGSPKHPGIAYIFGLAIFPMTVGQVIVSDSIVHNNFGDLIGTLNHNDIRDVLNNHDSLNNPAPPGPYTFLYDDSGSGDFPGSKKSDGPGSLQNFTGTGGIGPWQLTEEDTALTQTGYVAGYTLTLVPHQDLTKGITVTIQPGTWFYDYVDAPVGYTNLTVSATNLTLTPDLANPLQLFVKLGSPPTAADTNDEVLLVNGTPPGNSISIGPPLTPGRYFVGIFNPSPNHPQTVYILATLAFSAAAIETVDYDSSGPVPLLDDAVTDDSIFVPRTDIIQDFNIGLRVDHPRISDLVFHLIAPDGTRYLMMENRGGTSTNGCGGTLISTNIIPVSHNGGPDAVTNSFDTGSTSGSFTINYDFYTLPDTMDVYDGNTLLTHLAPPYTGNDINGTLNLTYSGSPIITIIMNAGGNTNYPSTQWTYTVQSSVATFQYLTFTEDTNETTTPIKFAPPPFVPFAAAAPVPTNLNSTWHSSFESSSANFEPTAGMCFPEGWLVTTGSIDYQTAGTFGSSADEGIDYVDMDGVDPGTISTNIPTVPGQSYVLNFAWSRNADSVGLTTPEANVLVDSNVVGTLIANINNTWTNLEWQSTSYVFTATAPFTQLSFQSLDTGKSYPLDAYGVLLDAIDVASGLTNGFENTYAGDYVAGVNPVFGGWTAISNQVTVITDPTLAYQGTNLLALADGQITRTLTTVPGLTYTLNFAYRGPGIAGMWRGENNANDSIYGDNGVNSGTYTGGEVGQAFHFNGLGKEDVQIPDSPLLRPASVTAEAWVNLDALASPSPPSAYPGLQYIIFHNNGNGSGDFEGYNLEKNRLPAGDPNGQDVFRFEATSGGNQVAAASITIPQTNVWYHLAGTFDNNSQTLKIYVNGVLEGTAFTGFPLQYGAGYPLYIGTSGEGFDGRVEGAVDEASVYDRALSASEIKAIYQKGSAGKFDPVVFATSPAESLAEATVNLLGAGGITILGDNTNWQTTNITFTASSSNTVLQINGIEPGILLDDFYLTATSSPTGGNLFYQPEESMQAIDGQSAYGNWTLEIQDDRAGATNNATLLSWQLEFTFANTNIAPAFPPIPILPPGVPYTNVVPGIVATDPINWAGYQVPVNAIAGSNVLFWATAPVNFLYSRNYPPTTGQPGDAVLLANVTSGVAVLTSVSTPPLVPGGIYYLGAQNNNGFDVTNSFTAYFITPEATIITNGGPQTNTVPPGGYNYYSVTVPTNADFATNLLLFATGPLNLLFDQTTLPTGSLPGDFTLLSSVTSGASVLSAGSSPPLVPGQTYFLGIHNTGTSNVTYGIEVNFHLLPPLVASNSIVWELINVPTNADFATNILVFANAPLNIWWSTNNPPTITNAGDVMLLPDATYPSGTNGQAVLGTNTTPAFIVPGGSYWLGVENTNGFSVTNDVEVHFHLLPQVASNSIVWELINVPTNADFATNLLVFATAPLNIWWSTNNPPTITNANDFDMIPGATNGAYVLGTTGTPNIVPGGSYWLGVQNTNGFAASYNVQVNFHLLSLVASNSIVWELINVPTNADFATNLLLVATAPVNVWWSTNNPPTTTNANDFDMIPGATNGAYVLGISTTPAFIVPGGSYWLGVENTNGFTVSYDVEVSFHFLSVVASNSVTWEVINVPTNADFATNFLLVATAPVNVWWSTNNPPTTTNANDFDMIPGATNGAYVLGTNTAPAFIVPGGSYWLGVENTNSFAVSYDVQVIFHLLVSTNAPAGPIVISSIVATNQGGQFGYLLTWFAPSNDLFQVQWMPGLASASWNTFTNIITYNTNAFTSPTHTQFNFFDDGTQTGGFGPARFYRLVLLQSLTNGIPQTNSAPSGTIDYFLVNVPTNADFATNLLLFATGPVNLLFNQTAPPTGTNPGDYTLLAGATNGLSILSPTSVPTNFVPGGSYWLGVQNTNSFTVTFALAVDFHLLVATNNPVLISSITFTNMGGTNGFLLRWLSRTNNVFQVQWGDGLSPANWQFFTGLIYYTGPLTPTNGWFSFFDDGTQTPPGLPPTRFYRIVLVGSIPSTHTNAVFISSVTVTNTAGTNALLLAWFAPTNYLFEVEWTTNLVPVVTWQTVPNILAYSTFVSPTNSLFDFLDDGSLTVPLGVTRFYRLLILP